MARKGILANITGDTKLTTVNSEGGALAPPRAPSPSFVGRGAFGAVTKTIDELAANARAIEARLTAGETVVDLDPGCVDASFMADRLGADDAEFQELVEAIRARGQDSPILVRPHPDAAGRYQIAFGHRRWRAAKALLRPVRAVVKKLDDRDLVLAQGQENSARANLSFIERALFAHRLEAAGYDRELIMSALGVDKTVVSRMIQIAGAVPAHAIAAIGPAPGVGRHRWLELSACVAGLGGAELAKLLTSERFVSAASDARFDMALDAAMGVTRSGAKPKSAGQGRGAARVWSTAAGEPIARASSTPRSFTLAIEEARAPGFGEFLMRRMDRLHAEYAAERGQSVEDQRKQA